MKNCTIQTNQTERYTSMTVEWTAHKNSYSMCTQTLWWSQPLTLIREFLGPSPNALSEKKNKNIACDVTLRTEKIKTIWADRVWVELSHDANLKWHMPIWEEICEKYMPFFGIVTERDFRKKNPKHRNIYKRSNATLWIFSCRTRSVAVTRFGFFSRIHG